MEQQLTTKQYIPTTRRLRRIVAFAAVAAWSQTWAATDDVDARLQALEAEIAALKKIQSEQPKLKADAKGVTIASSDGAYSFTLGGGIAQLDGNYYGGADTTSNNDFIPRNTFFCNCAGSVLSFALSSASPSTLTTSAIIRPSTLPHTAVASPGSARPH